MSCVSSGSDSDHAPSSSDHPKRKKKIQRKDTRTKRARGPRATRVRLFCCATNIAAAYCASDLENF